MKARPALAVLLLLLLSLAPAAGGPPEAALAQRRRLGVFPTVRLRVGRGVRLFRLVVPPAAARRAPVPLVFAFHGFSQEKDGFARYTRLDRLAQREGFILVYPNGVGRQWDQRGRGNPDVAFFDALYRYLAARYPIDRARVYATGFSMGGFFTNLLAAQRSEVLAAAAPHSGWIGRWAAGGINARRKYPVLVIQGGADRVVSPSAGRETRDRYLQEGHAVTYLEIPGLGHEWAAREAINERIWAFFREHPREEHVPDPDPVEVGASEP